MQNHVCVRKINVLHALLRCGVVKSVQLSEVEVGGFLADLAGVAVGDLGVAEEACDILDADEDFCLATL